MIGIPQQKIRLCCGIFFDRQNHLYIFLTPHEALISDGRRQKNLSYAHERVDSLTIFLVESKNIDAIMCT